MGKNDEFAAGGARPPLTDHEKQVLDFAREPFPTNGHRLRSMLSTFGYGETEFFSKLNRLRSHPEAVEYAPDVIRRANETIDNFHTRLGRAR